MTEKEFLGTLATIVGLLGFIPYLRTIFRGRTKPHAFSWLVWASIMTVAFGVQISSGAGAGAWVTGVQALLCIVIFVIALFVGERSFPLFDWAALASAFLALLLWRAAQSPLLAIILLSLTDAAGFLPTYRKGWQKPFEESMSVYTFSTAAYICALFALQTYTLTTWLYPASLTLTNTVCVALLVTRRIISPQHRS